MIKMSIVLTVFVILSSFASNSETKQFCDSFQENGYKIDYSLEFYTFRNFAKVHYYVRDLIVFIGSEYWIIETKDPLLSELHFNSLESQSHKLSGHYSAAFLLDTNYTIETNFVGFIRKNETKIEWKELKSCPTKKCVEIKSTGAPTQLSLPDVFIPSATFSFYRNDVTTKYIALVDQKPDSSDSSLFTRKYVVQSVPKHPSFPDLTSESVYNRTFTGRNDLIIGTMGQWDQLWANPPIVYSRKGDILFCNLKDFDSQKHDRNDMFDIAFNECSDRQIIIQCPFEEKNPTDVMTTEGMTEETNEETIEETTGENTENRTEEISTEQTTTPKTEEKSSAVYWVIAILIAIIIVVIVCCLLCLRYYRRDVVNPSTDRKESTKGAKFDESKITLSSSL